MVSGGKVDMAANRIFRTQKRLDSKKFTFSAEHDEEVIKMLVKKTTENNQWLFLSPFTFDTWYLILFTVIAIGPILYFVNANSRYYEPLTSAPLAKACSERSTALGKRHLFACLIKSAQLS